MKKHILISFYILLIIGGVQKLSSQDETAVLFIVSNQHTYGNTDINTANHFGELVYPYDVFVKAGYTIDFVSPQGGAIPIGYISTSDDLHKKYIYNEKFMQKLKYTLQPEQVIVSKYKAVYFGGGGAAMFGIHDNKDIMNLVKEVYENGGIVSAVCHGSAGLTGLKDSKGEPLFKGRKLTGFPDKFENQKAAYYQTFPFSIQEELVRLGGEFLFSEEGWDGHFIIDGRWITGQDPSGAAEVANNIVQYFKSKS